MTDSIVVNTAILMPVFALIAWSLVVFIRMYAMRMPAMAKAEIDPQSVKHPGALKGILPTKVEASADNYNHLFEQPTIFYVIIFIIWALNLTNTFYLSCAWIYFLTRVIHSIFQATLNLVWIRFSLFIFSWLILALMIFRVSFNVLI